MKFKELFEIYDVIDRDATPERGAPVGEGGFASVEEHPTDEHMVVKRNHAFPTEYMDEFEDGYPPFIEALVRDEIWKKNPHFPRIYTKSNDEWEMEKLVTWENLDAMALMGWIERYCTERVISSAITAISYDDEAVSLHYKEHGDFGEIDATMNKVIRLTLVGKIATSILLHVNHKREDFVSGTMTEALDWVMELMKSEGLLFDLHKDNFMWRHGPHGVQLVITDPVVGKYK